MGIDLGAMFGDALNSAKQGMTDVLAQGGNSALGYLEGKAISVIQADQTVHEEAAKASITNMLSQPANPGSFGSYLSGLASQPVIKQYGVYILGGVALVVGVTLLMRK